MGYIMAFNDEEKEEFKQAVKEAANEWLDRQFAAFGKWGFFGLAAVALSLFIKYAVYKGQWP